MADKIVSDLLMKFVPWLGGRVVGESSTTLPKDRDDMWRGFAEGYILELTKFSFKAGLGGDEGDAEARNLKKAVESQKAAAMQDAQARYKADYDRTTKENEIRRKEGRPDLPLPSAPKNKTPSASLGYKQFRKGGAEGDKARYPVDLKPIELSRLADRTSPILLDHCIHRKVFQSATLIKRKAAGSAASGEIFLRMDFHHVLLKSVEWTNDTPIEEEIEFVCRGVTLHYKPQLPDGSLGAAIPVFWKSPLVTAITQETLRA